MARRRITIARVIAFDSWMLEYYRGDENLGEHMRRQVAQQAGDIITEALLNNSLDQNDPIFMSIGEPSQAASTAPYEYISSHHPPARQIEVKVSYGDKRADAEIERVIAESQVNRIKVYTRPSIEGAPRDQITP